MSVYKDMRIRHHKEIRRLLQDHSHMTITKASNYLGVNKTSLRKMAYDYGVGFEKTHGEGKTSTSASPVKYKNYRSDVTLPDKPW